MRGSPSLRMHLLALLRAAAPLVGCRGGREPLVAGALAAVALGTCTPALAGPDVMPVPSAGRAADG